MDTGHDRATDTGFVFRHRQGFSTEGGFGTEGMSTRAYSAMRIIFGLVFLLDGVLKWILFQQGTMQATVQGFGISVFSDNWVLFGALVALGETAGGLALVVGLFQRPAALWSASIMLSIWVAGGFGGAYAFGSGWSFAGYTDPGGDLMLALAFLGLVFSPYAYSLASRFRLRERWRGPSNHEMLLRFLVT